MKKAFLAALLSAALFAMAGNTISVCAQSPEEMQTELSTKEEAKAEDKEAAKNKEEAETETETEIDPDELIRQLEEDEEQQQAEDAIFELSMNLRDKLPEGNGSWSVYVRNLTQGVDMTIGSHPMQAASLIKLYIMGAIYERYDEMTQKYGKDSIENNLYYMITVSDNDCANNLTKDLGYGDAAAGMAAVNNFCIEHEFNDTTMGRLLLQSKENGDNITSVKDCGEFLRQVYRGAMGIGTTTLSYPDKMYELLKQQQRRHKIPSQMPSGVGVANKTGELFDVENDAAIIYDTALGNDLVVVFMSEYLQDVGPAQSTIGSLARYIYDYYNS